MNVVTYIFKSESFDEEESITIQINIHYKEKTGVKATTINESMIKKFIERHNKENDI